MGENDIKIEGGYCRTAFKVKSCFCLICMKKKILDIGEPLARNYQDYAFPSAAMYKDEGYINWLYSNTIQLYFDSKDDKKTFTYFYNGISINPLSQISIFQRQYIKSEILKKSPLTVIEYIKLMIEDDYYFTTSVNEFYVPDRLAYQKYDFNHGIMIYGYDMEKGIFNTAGYNSKFNFGLQQITFELLEKAFLNTGKNIGCQSFKRNDSSYNFDIYLVKNLIMDYLTSKNTSKDLRIVQNPLTNCTFGMDAYREILKQEVLVDQRIFYTIYEHKLLMLQRIEKIYKELGIKEIKSIHQDYKEVVLKAKVLLNVFLKHYIQQERDTSKISTLLKDILEEDNRLLTKLVQYI